MLIEKTVNSCTGCGTCMNVCPTDGIHMEFDSEGFYYPIIDTTTCIECGKCEKVCQVITPVEPCSHLHAKVYCGKSKDIDLLKSSSSGGVIGTLANRFIQNNGIVYGAYYDCKNRVLRHASTQSVKIDALRKSKYMESYIGYSYREVQSCIDKGIPVLFVGTPCQIVGLKAMIRDPQKLLLTVDFVCHGVPSARLFAEHLFSIYGNKEIKELDFRDKQDGWKRLQLSIIDANNKKRLREYTCDSFYCGFQTPNNAILRKSCYECQYRQTHYADITVADYWNYREATNITDVEFGLSIIVANSEIGDKFVHSMQNFELTELPQEKADYLFKERDYSKSMEIRKQFYKVYYSHGFEKAAHDTYYDHRVVRLLKYKCKMFIKRFVKTLEDRLNA